MAEQVDVLIAGTGFGGSEIAGTVWNTSISRIDAVADSSAMARIQPMSITGHWSSTSSATEEVSFEVAFDAEIREELGDLGPGDAGRGGDRGGAGGRRAGG